MIKTAKPFLNEDFLLETDTAVELFHRHAAPLPILDYHNHLSPKDIAENRQFKSLTEVWLAGDHYKWRAMRSQGVPEKYCTGNATDREKFSQWAATVPHTLRNPLYHWTHLELRNYFGVDQLLSSHTADEIFDHCNELLQQDSFRVQGLLRKMNVEVVCTTDDPADSLEYHRQFASETLRMLPTFRPDKTYAVDQPDYPAYLKRLGEAANLEINNVQSLLDALANRIQFFAEHGCRASDHGLEQMPPIHATNEEADQILAHALAGKPVTRMDAAAFCGYVLRALSELYFQHGWAQQFHLGALRNNNTRMRHQLGADAGFDSIGDFEQARPLAQFLDALDRNGHLAKTILYNLNPADNEVFAAMAGNFNDGVTPGKMQYGAAWWFLDQKDGMEKQLNALSNLGLLSRFVGMVTDSRSFLSFPRHEYFRRILCNVIGREVERGELPDDLTLLSDLVKNVCYVNAKNYFRF
jgi:glucuronate isomerase